MNLKKFPWVFWIRISIRKRWFAFFWKSRGANVFDIQIWIFNITIGIPWSTLPLESDFRDYKTLKYAKKTNDSFKNKRFTLQIGSYEGFIVE